MIDAFLGLGSNIGDRKVYLDQALDRLAELSQTSLLAVSSTYQTPAWGLTDQADFLNLVCHIETELSPLDLLRACQTIEDDLGRVRKKHWGPRTLDIDLLLYGQELVEEPDLTLPHPYIKERAFVLVPLLELDEKLLDPKTGQPYSQALANLPQEGIEKISD